MALATRCPRCDATFRVVSDQLKLRGGLVRCGSCRHVFDAIGSLSYVEESALQVVSTDQPDIKAPLPLTARPTVATPPTASEGTARPQAQQPAPPEVGVHDPLAVPTLVIPEAKELGKVRGGGSDVARVDAEPPDRPRRPKPGRSDAPSANKSPRPSIDDIDIDTAAAIDTASDGAAADPEPEFLHQGGQRRSRSIVYGVGALLLGVALAGQAGLLMRTEILKRWPDLRPHVVEACRHYGCQVAWPGRADQLAVVGSELQQLPGTNVFELSAVIRNRASFRIALPAVELTLTDPANRILARKVFTAAETLASAGEPAARLDEGIDPGVDHVVRLTFEARGVSPASFVVYPFYP